MSDRRGIRRDLQAPRRPCSSLSASLLPYDDATSFGYAPGSVQAWAPDAEGATLAFSSLSVAVGGLRSKVRAAAPVDRHEVFGGHKPAEVDRRRKRGDGR